MQQFIDCWNSDSSTLTVHTSGSTGKPRPMEVEKSRMRASAITTCRFLGLKKGDTALLCMPLEYIAGQMMVVRSIVGELNLISVESSSHPMASLAGTTIDFAAMVPLQVVSTLQVESERKMLMAIRHLIIGGGAIDSMLAAQLADFPNAVWSTYGMTETLSHIALRRLNGPERSEWYTPFGGAELSLTEEGCLMIDAPAICSERLVTNDIAELKDGRFRIIGRRDNVVCSGGLKIQIEEFEQLLKPHIPQPFMLTKAPHHALGQQLVMLCEGETDVAGLDTLCRSLLPRHYHPQAIFSVEKLPLTATGKPARAAAEEMAKLLCVEKISSTL